MSNQFEDKKLLVVGGTSGMGLQTAGPLNQEHSDRLSADHFEIADPNRIAAAAVYQKYRVPFLNTISGA